MPGVGFHHLVDIGKKTLPVRFVGGYFVLFMSLLYVCNQYSLGQTFILCTKGFNVLMLCNMEFQHRANVLLAIARVLHYSEISGSRLACPNQFVFVHVEDEGVLL